MKKTRWTLIPVVLVIILTLFVISCSGAPVSTPYQLTILHTSENHGHLEPVEISKVSQGGIACRASLVKKLRAETANSLLLDSGDVSQVTFYFTQYRGAEGRVFYNLL